MKLANETYKRSQADFLQALRDARNGGETLTNLADALQVSKQWIHKFTTHGLDHNKVTSKRRRSDEDETPLGGSTAAPAIVITVVPS